MREDGREGTVGGDAHGHVVDAFDRVDWAQQEARGRGHSRVTKPLQREHDVRGRERFTVVEGDAGAELEVPRHIVDPCPTLR